MNQKLPKIVQNRLDALKKQRQELLRLPAEKALDFILEAPQPAALVHSLPDQDLYFLVHDIGPADALPVVALASNRQWEFMLDAEIWQRDRLDVNRLTPWFDLFLRADPRRLIKWCLEEKIELTELYLYRSMQVVSREHDQDPSIFGDGFFTHDDTFYIRLLDSPENYEDDNARKTVENRHRVVDELISRFAAFDHIKYQHLLLETAAVIPAEMEEECYRLRNVRLAERGFAPFEEALAVYAPLTPDQVTNKLTKVFEVSPNKGGEMVPLADFPASLLSQDNLFARALASMAGEAVMPQLQAEFAALCNQIIAADQKAIQVRDQLRQVVKKACGYLSIGLLRLSGQNQRLSPKQAASHLKHWPLAKIFRAGYGMALELKWQAEKWQAKSWSKQQGLPLSFWDEGWMGVLGGLLLKRPLYFDNFQTGVIYRQFENLSDISTTQQTLDDIIRIDTFLGALKIDLPKDHGHIILTYKNFLLTLWARAFLGLETLFKPIPFDQFKGFFEILLPDPRPAKIGQNMQTAFLEWLAQKAESSTAELGEKVGSILTDLFSELESEYGLIAPNHIDPRFMPHFWIAPPAKK